MEWTPEKEQMFHDNMPLAYYFMNQFLREIYLCPEDIESLCLYGLMQAVDAWDESRGIKFSTFASICIRNQMLMALRKEKPRRAQEVLFSDLVLVDKHLNENKAEEFREDMSDPADGFNEFVDRNHVEWLMQCLNERERTIIRLYYLEGIPQRKVAEMVGMSRTYARKTIHAALQKMRKYERAKMHICDSERGETNTWPKITFACRLAN